MTKQGFRLRKLEVSGRTKSTAAVEFTSGLNVITGASNTGKTYIFQCLDFMFGAEKAPKPLEESAGYARVALELSTPEGLCTLERALEGGDFELIRAGISSVETDSPQVLVLRDRHDKKNADNISTFLLRASGFSAAKLRKNVNNELVDLSFRTINQLFVVDETTIIQERSPLLKPLGYSDTQQKSAFNFILTGKDDSAVVSKARNEETKRELRVKEEILSSLIKELETRLGSQTLPEGTPGAIREIEERFVATSSQISRAQVEISRLQKEISSERSAFAEHESDLITKRGLLQRFHLLLRNYETDLARLEAVSEAEHYFKQLQPVLCPLCSNPIERHGNEGLCDDQDWGNVAAAALAEARKIAVLKKDLEMAIESLAEEEKELHSKIVEHRRSIVDLQRSLRDQQVPVLAAHEGEMQRLISLKHRLDESTSLRAQINEMIVRRDAVMADITLVEKQSKPAVRSETAAQAALCAIIGETLHAWQFKFAGDIHFDQKTADFVIGGKARQSNGKGIRALMHAAFVVSLMKYCRKRGLPHPGVLVLDSPLTTLKEGVSSGEAEEIPQHVQDAFFTDLADNYGSEQIIVIENKEPPKGIRSRINYLAFTGGSRPGRPGFFPVAKKRS